MKVVDIVIIGAGIAGLSCAAKLKSAGLDPVILDKGRGIGGRLATRRAFENLQFDHGAQYVTAKTDSFQNLLDEAENEGNLALWDEGQKRRYVGTPGMNGLAKHLARDLTVLQNVEVTGITNFNSGYEIQSAEQKFKCSRLVITIPAPQAKTMMKPLDLFKDELGGVEMLPCLTLMAAFETSGNTSFVSRRDADDDLSWIAFDSSKPNRRTENCWVAQASPEWSIAHLEEAPVEIAQKMLPMLCERIGASPKDATHAVAHRWRYAAVSKPLGKPFLKSPDSSIYLGGDWCLAARVEAAWTSGAAMADDVLSIA